jgi:hypothetical protein
MHLTKAVAKLACERGQITADDIAPLFPEYSRRQVMYALRNATKTGEVQCMPGKSLGRYGRSPGTYTAQAVVPVTTGGKGISDEFGVWIEQRAIQDENGCLIWKDGMCRSRPVGRINGRTKQVRREIWEQQKGRPMPVNFYAVCKHGVDECVEPSHVIGVTRSAVQKKRGKPLSAAHRQAIAEGRWGGRSKLSAEKAAEIRASDEPRRVLAERYGVSERLVTMVRSGEIWRDYSSPFAGLFTGLVASNDSERRRA